MSQFCMQCRITLEDHQQLCPFCKGEGCKIKGVYCPTSGIRLHQSHCPYCGTEAASPDLEANKKELFLVLIRGFQADSPEPEAAMHLLRLLYTAGIYTEHRESLDACLNALDESHAIVPLIIYLLAEYRGDSEEWFNKHSYNNTD